jgi:DUF2971 family protein
MICSQPKETMILYKYVSKDVGIEIIKKNSIGFSNPCDFNDPFELEAAYPSIKKDNLDDLFRGPMIWVKKHIWKHSTGILSLTRQPLNPLMWVKYGKEHTGMVIGLDSSINEFTCEDTNLLPVQFGSVIYTNSKPDSPFLSKPTEILMVGSTFHFPIGQLECLQRMFLFKPMCWSYEEEVRIAKCLDGIEKNKNIQSGSFSKIKVDDRPIYLLNLPKNTIKEIYIGTRSELRDNEKALGFLKLVKDYQPQAKTYRCGISNTSWSLESFDLE